MNYNEQRLELDESKRILERITENHIISASYPHGSYNNDTLKISAATTPTVLYANSKFWYNTIHDGWIIE